MMFSNLGCRTPGMRFGQTAQKSILAMEKATIQRANIIRITSILRALQRCIWCMNMQRALMSAPAVFCSIAMEWPIRINWLPVLSGIWITRWALPVRTPIWVRERTEEAEKVVLFPLSRNTKLRYTKLSVCMRTLCRKSINSTINIVLHLTVFRRLLNSWQKKLLILPRWIIIRSMILAAVGLTVSIKTRTNTAVSIALEPVSMPKNI